MLDIVPFVSIQVRAHVLLFKPQLGARLGDYPGSVAAAKPS
jgi:hypothetical protein